MHISHEQKVNVNSASGGKSYDGQQTDVICDVRGPCQTIRSTLKLVFR